MSDHKNQEQQRTWYRAVVDTAHGITSTAGVSMYNKEVHDEFTARANRVAAEIRGNISALEQYIQRQNEQSFLESSARKKVKRHAEEKLAEFRQARAGLDNKFNVDTLSPEDREILKTFQKELDRWEAILGNVMETGRSAEIQGGGFDKRVFDKLNDLSKNAPTTKVGAIYEAYCHCLEKVGSALESIKNFVKEHTPDLGIQSTFESIKGKFTGGDKPEEEEEPKMK